MINEAFPIAKLASLIFMMMGPIGLIPIFSGLTAGAATGQRRRIAVRAFGYSSIALTLAVAIGAGVLKAWGASPPALIIAAGTLLGLASLRNLLAAPRAPAGSAAQAPDDSIALAPLAFPSIVTPHGVGVLIVFVAYAPGTSAKASILGVALGIMALNLLTMLFADRLMRLIGRVPLTILGAVFGVLQLALGIEMLASGAALLTAAGG
jgi:multiple antibiotic resistance protein